jgi:hypothetical protein
MGCSRIGKIGLPSASGRFVKAQTLCGPVSGGIGRGECSKNCVSAPPRSSSAFIPPENIGKILLKPGGENDLAEVNGGPVKIKKATAYFARPPPSRGCKHPLPVA